MVPDASLLSAQHIRTCLASLSPLNLVQKREMNASWKEWSRVINISWDRPEINKFKLNVDDVNYGK